MSSKRPSSFLNNSLVRSEVNRVNRPLCFILVLYFLFNFVIYTVKALNTLQVNDCTVLFMPQPDCFVKVI